MDKHLVAYLGSGKAWVLVGSGPSLQMGYPGWPELATKAAHWAIQEVTAADTTRLNQALAHRNWALVFTEITKLLGSQARLLQFLGEELKPMDHRGEIYDLIARWPIPVYLTTNWDDELHNHLAKLREAYLPYNNSPEHMALLTEDLQGVIVKLHGDLRSVNGMIMTDEQYEDIDKGTDWRHWREKMSAVFQMKRVVVIGHSLSDPHIRHVLAAAKWGAGIVDPVVWLAPDTNDKESRQFLEKHRVRVVSYDNRDGRHTNLFRLLRDVTQFVPPRERIAIRADLEAAIPTASKSDSAVASALLVHSKLSEADPLEEMRVRLIVAALESAIPQLSTRQSFTLQDALSSADWPANCPLGAESTLEVAAEAEKQGLLVRIDQSSFCVAPEAVQKVSAHMASHQHLRHRFHRAVDLRIGRLFPALEHESIDIAIDIDNALIGCFREDGFAMAASTLGKAASSHRNLPTRILEFLNGASAKYPDLLRRQAFTSTVLDILENPTSADSQYLGALISGYCAFNYLGVFGDIAIERVRHAADTVWLIDSDLQIPALALAAPTNAVFLSCFRRLHAAGVRLFTLQSLFEETLRHYRFAKRVIVQHGQTSPEVLYAAQGQVPYRKSNQFLQGFVRWQAAGNPADWESYLQSAFGDKNPDAYAVRSKLEAVGVTVVEFQDWPGFVQDLFAERDEQTSRITEIQNTGIFSEEEDTESYVDVTDASRKAKPEAEAMLVSMGERDGCLHILSASPKPSGSWFVSHTSILNKLSGHDLQITWWPESFLRFTESLPQGEGDSSRAERIFQALLWTFAQSGVNGLDRKTVEEVFGSVGEQCEVYINEQRGIYSSVLFEKYGRTPEQILRAVPVEDRPLALVQMANEVAAAESRRADELAQRGDELAQRHQSTLKEKRALETELDKLGKFKKRLVEREAKTKRNKRKAASKSKKKRR